jgi:hypothetical protein
MEVAEELMLWEHGGLTFEQAKDHQTKILRHRYDITPSQLENSVKDAPDKTPIEIIDDDEQWVNLVVTVDELWDVDSAKVEQAGRVRDDTDVIKFVSFDESTPTLKSGENYIIEDAVTSEFRDKHEVVLNSATTVNTLNEPVNESGATDEMVLDDDNGPATDPIDTETQYDTTYRGGEETRSVTGTVVDVADDSGIIEVCPHNGCQAVLTDGECPTHDAINQGKREVEVGGWATLNTSDGEFEVAIPAPLIEEILGVSEKTLIEDDSILDERNDIRNRIEDVMLTQWVEAELTVGDDTMVGVTVNPEIEDSLIDTVADAYTDD